MTAAVSPSLAAQLRARRTEMMVAEVEAVALRLFEERGFDAVTVEDVATEAGISVRTFYRYFPTKEAVLQLKTDQRSQALRQALAARPTDEAPLRSLRLAFEHVVSAEDMELRRRWISVIVETPSVLNGVIGGIQLKTQRVLAEFLGARFELPSDALLPTMLAAAAQGVVQAAHTRWFVHGGNLSALISGGLRVLERGIGAGPADLED